MKLKFQKSQIEVNGNITEMNFNIKGEDMGLILEILRSKMYSNPIAAISREISSNSRDANRENKKSNIPIEIGFRQSIFNQDITTVYFKDFGPGISEERMADVFVNYGSSTKRISNTQTGGYGLGAKTPFAYTDNFTITTVVDKTRYTYIAAIEGNKSGKIYLMEKESTDEENGTEISIPIESKDQRTFEEEIISTVCFWKTLPTLKNFRNQSFYRFPEISEFTITEKDYNVNFSSNCVVLVDEIPYFMEMTELLEKIKIGRTYYLRNKIIIIPVKTGEISISANRETIHWDEITIKKITKKVRDYIDKITKEIQEKIDNEANLFDATCLYNQIKNKMSPEMSFLSELMVKFNYQGSDIPSEISSYLIVSRIDENGKERFSSFKLWMYKVPVYFIDASGTHKSRNTTILKDNKCFMAVEYSFLPLRRFNELKWEDKKYNVVRMRRTLKEIKKLEKMGVVFKKYSEVERSKKTYEQINRSTNIVLFGPRGLATEKLEYINKNSVYQVYKERQEIFKYRDLSSFLKRIYKQQLIFVTERQVKKLPSEIISTVDFFKTMDKTKIQEIANENYVHNNIEFYRFENYKKLNFNGQAVYIQKIYNFRYKAHSTYIPEGIDNHPDKEIIDAVEKCKEVMEKYPLLKHVNYIDGSNTDVCNEYISLMDKKELLLDS